MTKIDKFCSQFGGWTRDRFKTAFTKHFVGINRFSFFGKLFGGLVGFSTIFQLPTQKNTVVIVSRK